MSRNRRFISYPLSRRSLIQRGSALGAGAAFGGLALANAQTPGASPAAMSATEMDPDFAAAQEEFLAQFPVEGKTLRMLSAVTGGKTPEEDQLFADEIQRLTGITVELVHPTAEYDQKVQADLAAGVEYDLIYMGKPQMDVLIEQEVFTDLTDQIEGSAILSNPTVVPTDEWDQITYEDRIYSVFNKAEGARMLTVRQDWLDQLGLEAPRTLEDIYNVMVAFRDEDPAGNGEGATLGLSTAGTYDIQPFMSAEGVLPGYVMDGDRRTIPYATEAAIPVYEWLANLYAEGLYDPNFATAETADMRNLFMTDRVGFVTYWDTWVGLFNQQVHAANPDSSFQAAGIAAAEGPDGSISIVRGQPGVWTIPVNAPDPETAFLFLEWWNTIPGITLGTLGILDHDYTGEGENVELTEVGTEHAMDHGQPTPYNTNWQNPVGELPGLSDAQEISFEYGYLETLGPDWNPTIKPILDGNIIQIIQGDLSPADGVAAMREALLNEGLIDE